MSDNKTTLNELKESIEKFVSERDWQQFHSPKNLSMAISIESAELMDIFKWYDNLKSKEMVHQDDFRESITDEIADIFIYCLAFANRTAIDITDAVNNKLIKNAIKYPSEIFKGKF